MRVQDVVRLLLLAAIWGASFMFMRIASPVLGAMNNAFFRVLFAACGLGLILWLLRTPLRFDKKLPAALALGVINSGIPFLMYCLAARLLPAGYSSILNATTPLMGVLIGFLFFGESLTLKKVTGVVLGLIGIVLLTSTGGGAVVSAMVLGVVACLVATGCYAVAGFLTRKWISQRGGLDAKLVALGSQLGACAFLFPFFLYALAFQPAVEWHHSGAWLAVMAVGLICTAWAYIIYFRLIADIGPVRSMTVTFLIPPFGILWGKLFLDEHLSSGFILGGLVICLAVWLILSPAKKTQPAG